VMRRAARFIAAACGVKILSDAHSSGRHDSSAAS
jgi:hypothetical protein